MLDGGWWPQCLPHGNQEPRLGFFGSGSAVPANDLKVPDPGAAAALRRRLASASHVLAERTHLGSGFPGSKEEGVRSHVGDIPSAKPYCPNVRIQYTHAHITHTHTHIHTLLEPVGSQLGRNPPTLRTRPMGYRVGYRFVRHLLLGRRCGKNNCWKNRPLAL